MKRAWDCEPSLLVPSGHLETLVRVEWQNQKLLKARQVNALGWGGAVNTDEIFNIIGCHFKTGTAVQCCPGGWQHLSHTQLLGFSYPGNQSVLLEETDWENWYTLIYNNATEKCAISKHSPKCSQYLVCEILLISFSSQLEKAYAHWTLILKN